MRSTALKALQERKGKRMIKLGDKVKDKVSGFTGIVTEITNFLNGCTQCVVSPKVKKDGTIPAAWSIDIQQLVKVGVGINIKKKRVGGRSKMVISDRWGHENVQKRGIVTGKLKTEQANRNANSMGVQQTAEDSKKTKPARKKISRPNNFFKRM